MQQDDLTAFWQDSTKVRGLHSVVTSPQWDLYVAPFLAATIESLRTKLESAEGSDIVEAQSHITQCRNLLTIGLQISARLESAKDSAAV